MTQVVYGSSSFAKIILKSDEIRLECGSNPLKLVELWVILFFKCLELPITVRIVWPLRASQLVCGNFSASFHPELFFYLH